MTERLGTEELQRFRSSEAFALRNRWVLVAGYSLIILAWPPRDAVPIATIALLVVSNLASLWILPRLTTRGRARASAFGSLMLVNAAVVALSFSYGHLPESPAWVVFYFLPLSAALRFGIRGSLPEALFVTLLDAALHYYARERFGIAFEVMPLVLRTCVYFAIAVNAGGWARTIVHQRRALDQAAIEEARLRLAAEERARRFRALTEIQRQITERLDIGQVCNTVAQVALQLLTASHSRVWIHDAATGKLSDSAQGYGNGCPPAAIDALDDDMARAAAEGEQPVVAIDPDAGVFAVCLPMRFEGRVVGALGVAGPPAAPPDVDQMELLDALAASGAIAIENARLFEVSGEAEAFQRLDQLKSELVGTISHELRTPLTVILGFAELMADGDEITPATARAWAAEILRQSHVMTSQVDDLLTFAEVARGDAAIGRERVEVDGLLAAAAAEFGRLPGGGRLRLLACGPTVTWLDGDPARLHQVVSNLIGNALRYAPTGPVTVGCRGDGEWVRVEVTDTGPGVPADEQSRVWERFYRGQGVAGLAGPRATGLGLAVVKSTVEAHGGHVGLVCPPTGGSTFWFAVPAARAVSPVGTA